MSGKIHDEPEHMVPEHILEGDTHGQGRKISSGDHYLYVVTNKECHTLKLGVSAASPKTLMKRYNSSPAGPVTFNLDNGKHCIHTRTTPQLLRLFDLGCILRHLSPEAHFICCHCTYMYI